MLRENRQSTSAFTLVELLVVLAICGILAGIIIPAVSGVRTSAAIAQSSSNLRQLATANLNYAAANKGRFAYSSNWRNNKRWCAEQVNGVWDRSRGYLSPYLDKNEQAAYCPLLEDLLPEDGDRSFELGTGGYGYNDVYIGGREAPANRPQMEEPSARIAEIFEPSRTVMFTTTAYATGDTIQEYPFSHSPYWVVNGRVTGSKPSPTVHFRARGKALVAWADGHVSQEEPNEKLSPGINPHGGDATAQSLGWFGPGENNGYWNPQNHW